MMRLTREVLNREALEERRNRPRISLVTRCRDCGWIIDRRAFTYCTLNAVLNGIPAIHIHGDTLRMEVWDAFATLPIGRFALWERLRPEIARDLIVQSLKPPAEPVKPARPPIPKATVQASLFQDGEAA